jgi:phospholipase C
MPADALPSPIKHVFVLMLENRSFDHMLGFSGITGTDAETGLPTKINGLTGAEVNSRHGSLFKVSKPANFIMPIDPAHEFADVLEQLCGPDVTYPSGGPYPAMDGNGYVKNYVAHGGGPNPAEIMKCYSPDQLPVLTALAKEFAVCDRWHSSLPGPTWPNRFFAHAASSGGLDHSPNVSEILLWEGPDGFRFSNGTIFKSMESLAGDKGWAIYAGDHFPNVAALKGISLADVDEYEDFPADLSKDYPYLYTFIEPNYGDVVGNTYTGGTSQHPLDDVTHGERLIKEVYEAIRNSPLWETSLLIITWDEHGGFYDHVLPPAAVPPGDKNVMGGDTNQHGFQFDRYGPRVPAVVISPWIAKNVIDHTLYDHSSIPATLQAIFGLHALTARDAIAFDLTSLVSLSSPRTDTPTKLPEPANSGLPAAGPALAAMASPTALPPTDSVDAGNLPGFLHSALCTDLNLSPASNRVAILESFQAIRTRDDAERYLDKVEAKIAVAKTVP